MGLLCRMDIGVLEKNGQYRFYVEDVSVGFMRAYGDSWTENFRMVMADVAKVLPQWIGYLRPQTK